MLLNRINAEIAAEREHIKGLNEEARQKAAEKFGKQSSRTANTQKKQTFQHRDQLHSGFRESNHSSFGAQNQEEEEEDKHQHRSSQYCQRCISNRSQFIFLF